MSFYDKVRKILKMKKLKSVAWKVTGDDGFRPEKVEVRFEDIEGTVFEMVIHADVPLYRTLRSEEETILNVAFSHFGISSDHWIGVNINIDKMVNLCRQKAKYDGTFFVNESKCRMYDYLSPIHVF